MAGPDARMQGGGLALLPPLWLVATIGFAAWEAWALWPLLNGYEFSGALRNYIQVAVAVAIITVLWGLGVLALLIGRAPAFSRQFIVWQAAVIVWLVAQHAYTLTAGAFEFSARALAMVVGEIAIGALCIAIVRRQSALSPAGAADEGAAAAPAEVSTIGLVLVGILGVVLGAVLGFGAGIGLGSVIAEVADISCFEGGCGYFALFIGVGGLLFGAIVGPILAVMLARRRSRR